MFQNMGVWDWGIILVIVLVLFGGKRLPELARSLGESIAIFKKALKEGEEKANAPKDEPKNPDQPSNESH